DHGDAVSLGESAYVVRSSDGTNNRSLFTGVRETLAGVEVCTAVRDLNDDRATCLFGSLESGVGRMGTDHVDRRERSLCALHLCVQLFQGAAGDNAGLQLDFRHGITHSKFGG